MIALLLAAQVLAAPPTQPNTTSMTVFPVPREFFNPRNPMSIPAWCGQQLQRTDRAVPPPVPSVHRKLGELPRANLEYAVDSRVQGCPVRTLVRDNGRPILSE